MKAKGEREARRPGTKPAYQPSKGRNSKRISAFHAMIFAARKQGLITSGLLLFPWNALGAPVNGIGIRSADDVAV